MGIGMVEGGAIQTKECNRKSGSWTSSATEDGSSLLQKGVLFFSVTLLLTLLLALAVFMEMGSGSTGGQAAADTISFPGLVPDWDRFSGLRNPLLLLMPLTVLFITLISGLFFFIHYITVPLDKIGLAIRRMTAGRLDQHVQIAHETEIGQIGELINDLAINKQELLLYCWNHTQKNRELIDQIEKGVHSHPDRGCMVPLMEEIFAQLKQGNNDVKSMILLYDFYDLKLEKEKMLINPQTQRSER